MSRWRSALAVAMAAAFLFASTPLPALAASACGWSWSYSLDLAPGYWPVGAHSWEFRGVDPNGVISAARGPFQVTETAALYRGEVFLRRPDATPRSIGGPVTDRTLNARQDTVFQLTFVAAPGTSHNNAEAMAARTSIGWRWDDMTEFVIGVRGPLVPSCVVFSDPGVFKDSWFLRDFQPDWTGP